MDTYVFENTIATSSPRKVLSEEQFEHGCSRTYRVSEQLIVICNFFESISEAARDTMWKLDFSGWVSFHFRLEGVSREVLADGIESTMGGRTYIVTASNIKDFSYRQVMGDTWRTVTIMCHPDCLAEYQETWGGDQLLGDGELNAEGHAKDITCVTGQFSDEMLSCVMSLMNPKVDEAFYASYYQAKALELICLTYNQVYQKNSEGEALAVKLSKHDLLCIYEARNHILTLAELPSLSDLSRTVGLNRNKLSVGFKFAFGCTVGEFHRNKRLDEAYRRLCENEANISAISLDAGYKDHGSFSKAFKTKFGFLPSEVAKKLTHN